MRSYREIAREIELRIQRGDYPAGSLLPSRLELMREFQVARATLDRAVQELAAARRVTSRRGSGTTVNPLSEHRRRIALIGRFSDAESDALPSHCFPLDSHFLTQKSEWSRLFDFDGLLWRCPDSDELAVIAAMRDRIPQVVINRVLPGIHCVSTDHRGAYRSIAAERLAAHPDALPVFITSGGDALPSIYRFDGFADACRAAGVFYDRWQLPGERFDAGSAELRRRMLENAARPLVVLSDSMIHTGAMMRAAADAGRRWGVDLWYSDFDDDYPANVWGLRVTSFIQNFVALTVTAATRLERLISGTAADEPEHQLIFPLRRDGDT